MLVIYKYYLQCLFKDKLAIYGITSVIEIEIVVALSYLQF